MTKLELLSGRKKFMVMAYRYTAVVFVLGNKNTTCVSWLNREKESSH